ncbi:hypothetical protein BJV82DRAFT_584545 [Fennellomyces sp. T-0311]|nr:hypothetical protein BJV82DRAFT_584545 [Fennellomyces sp. T-0311]
MSNNTVFYHFRPEVQHYTRDGLRVHIIAQNMSLPELPEHDFESLFYEQQLDEDTTEITIAPKYIWTSTYSQKQVGALLDLCKNQGLSPQVAGSKLGIKKTAAYEFYNEALRNPAVLPGYKLASEVH